MSATTKLPSPPSGSNASGTIIATTVVTTGLTVIRHLHDGTFHFTVVFHGFMLGAGLLLLALASPSIAKMFAMLGLLGSFMVNGPTVFKALGVIK